MSTPTLGLGLGIDTPDVIRRRAQFDDEILVGLLMSEQSDALARAVFDHDDAAYLFCAAVLLIITAGPFGLAVSHSPTGRYWVRWLAHRMDRVVDAKAPLWGNWFAVARALNEIEASEESEP